VTALERTLLVADSSEVVLEPTFGENEGRGEIAAQGPLWGCSQVLGADSFLRKWSCLIKGSFSTEILMISGDTRHISSRSSYRWSLRAPSSSVSPFLALTTSSREPNFCLDLGVTAPLCSLL
jgi:hypothetical protein